MWADRGRRPQSPEDDCAGPATDPHSDRRDRAAEKKIEQALNTHYLAWQPFEKTQALLLGASKACEDKCSPRMQAKLWMYVGIIAGSGKTDYDEAQCAFRIAFTWDPGVELDEALCTPEAKAAFERERRDVCG